MNSCIQDAYAAMSAAVREQFDVPLYVREAYRTAKEQEEKTKENSAVAAEIGASEHQAGLALDLYIPQFGGWAFTKSAAGRFVDTNCRYYRPLSVLRRKANWHSLRTVASALYRPSPFPDHHGRISDSRRVY